MNEIIFLVEEDIESGYIANKKSLWGLNHATDRLFKGL